MRRRRGSGCGRAASTLPTVPGFFSHSGEADRGARAFGRGVVLVDDRAEPLDQPALDVDRTRRRAVDDVDAATTRRSDRARRAGSDSSRWNIVGTMCVCVTRCCSISAQRLLRIPAVHQHDRHTHRRGCRERERERRGVVQRTGAQVHVLSRRRSASASRATRSRASFGGARAHPSAGRSCPTCRASSRRAPGRRASPASCVGEHVFVALEAVDVAADRDLRREARRELGRADRGLGEARVGDERGRFAVVDDVARFLAGEVPVDRREPQPGPLRGRARLDELRTVPAEQRQPVARGDAACSQRARELVGAGVDLGERAVAVRRSAPRPDPGTARPRTTRACPGRPPRTARPDRLGLDFVVPTCGGSPSLTKRILGGPLRPRPAPRTPRRCRPSPRTGSRRCR